MNIGGSEKIIYKNPKENLGKGEKPLHTFDLISGDKTIGRAEITYFSKPFPMYQINHLYIESEYRGIGLGSEIMDQIEAFLIERKRAGVLINDIDPKSPASGMYERRGWQKIPGNIEVLYAYNLPKDAKLEDLRSYPFRQTDLDAREGWKENEN